VNALKQWYRDMTTAQRYFVYFVSMCLVLVYGFGLLPLSILIYLHLGKDN